MTKQHSIKNKYCVELWRKKADQEAEKVFAKVRAESVLDAADTAMHDYGVAVLAKVVVRSETDVETLRDVVMTSRGLTYSKTVELKFELGAGA